MRGNRIPARLGRMDYQNLVYARENGYVTLTLNRPERRNCLSTEMLAELADAFRAIASDGEVAGVVLAAAGPVFSSGHDLAEMARMNENELRELFELCTSVMTAIGEMPQVVVAQVHALATAAGAQLAASADLVVASEQAAFATPGGKGGLFCHTPMVAVSRALGQKRALEMALTGDSINAATALQWGLVNRVVPTDELESATLDLLTKATRGSRYSKGIGKQTLYAQMEMPTADAYELAIRVMATAAASGDGAEWPRAFIEKRHPNWIHTV